MKLLLDHCMPKGFGKLLDAHDVFHTSQLGWGHLENGKLLTAAEAKDFTALITVDGAMSKQQSLAGRRISLVVLRAKTNAIVDLQPLIAQVSKELKKLSPGTVIYIGDKILSSGY